MQNVKKILVYFSKFNEETSFLYLSIIFYFISLIISMFTSDGNIFIYLINSIIIFFTFFILFCGFFLLIFLFISTGIMFWWLFQHLLILILLILKIDIDQLNNFESSKRFFLIAFIVGASYFYYEITKGHVNHFNGQKVEEVFLMFTLDKNYELKNLKKI